MTSTAQPRLPKTIPPGRLWFAFAGGAAAWAAQGAVCVFISSNACNASGEIKWAGGSGAAVRIMLAVVTVAFLAVALTAAITAFRDWRELVGAQASLERAEGRAREEFLSLAGWIVGSLCLMGIFWAGLPLIVLNVCVRAH